MQISPSGNPLHAKSSGALLNISSLSKSDVVVTLVIWMQRALGIIICSQTVSGIPCDACDTGTACSGHRSLFPNSVSCTLRCLWYRYSVLRASSTGLCSPAWMESPSSASARWRRERGFAFCPLPEDIIKGGLGRAGFSRSWAEVCHGFCCSTGASNSDACL